jgi:hypothetical protein
MKIKDKELNVLQVVLGFLPLNLIIGQFKHNLFAILFWTILFGITADSMGYAFGIPFLFYSPEYMGAVSPWSFYLVGFALGGFIMGFNTYSYIKLGPYYPFLVSVNRPFLKFCINNSLIPLIFLTFYIFKIIQFQNSEEFTGSGSIFLYILALILGLASFVTLSVFYFFRMSFNFISKESDGESEKPIESVVMREKKWYDPFRFNRKRTYIYLGLKLNLQVSRDISHLDEHTVQQVYAKNRINSSFYEILTITIFFLLGLLSHYRASEVPAAASIILLITVFLMITSALQSWFGKWFYFILFGGVIGMNFMSLNTQLFQYRNYAYGLDYSNDLTEYSIANITRTHSNDSLIDASYENYISILEKWRASTGEEKPRLIIVNSSGGGSRSALWTFSVLQQADFLTKGKLTRNLHMITGASGGMVGAAYFRQLMIEKNEGRIPYIYAPAYKANIGKDLLNRLSFMASTNDIFIRYQKFKYNNHSYTKDRGFAFEDQLLQNTDNILDHNLGYYADYEQTGEIPLMILSPTVVNDGRRMLISPQNLLFLTQNNSERDIYENLDFQSMFKNPSDIRFTSVLRASSTFPFVMPMVTMPTTPEIQLMDAGIRDNYGTKTTLAVLRKVNSWIARNTSGVVIIRIRDTKSILDDESYNQVGFIDKITLPFNNVYKNFPRVQDFNQDELMENFLSKNYFPVEILEFNLRERKDDRISLSWHLTKHEKEKIDKAILSRRNLEELNRLKSLLE